VVAKKDLQCGSPNISSIYGILLFHYLAKASTK